MKIKREGSIYYWQGWDASHGKNKKSSNPYRKVKGTILELERINDPHWMWNYGYDMYIATMKTFGKE
jgi:hypothetical protein